MDWGGGAFWLLAPAIALSMGLSPAQVGVLFALRQIGSAVALLPAGFVGDSIRRREPFLLTTFWWVAVAQLAASVVPSYWSLGIWLAIASAGAAAWHPVAMGTMVQRMPDRRAFALAIHGIGGTVAEVVAPLGVGFLLAFLDWRQVLQINTVPALVMGLMFFRLSRMVSPSGEPSPSRSEVAQLARTFVQPATAGILLVMAFHNMSLLALMSMMPLYLEETRHFSPVLTGVAFAVFVVAGAVAAPAVGRVSDRGGRKPVTLLGLFGGAVCMWLVTVAHGAPGVFLVLLVAGALSLSVRVVLMAMAVEIVGRREATVLGFLSAIGEGLGAIGAAAAGLAAERSLATALVFAALLSLASGVVAVLHPFAPAKVPSKAAKLET